MSENNVLTPELTEQFKVETFAKVQETFSQMDRALKLDAIPAIAKLTSELLELLRPMVIDRVGYGYEHGLSDKEDSRLEAMKASQSYLALTAANEMFRGMDLLQIFDAVTHLDRLAKFASPVKPDTGRTKTVVWKNILVDSLIAYWFLNTKKQAKPYFHKETKDTKIRFGNAFTAWMDANSKMFNDKFNDREMQFRSEELESLLKARRAQLKILNQQMLSEKDKKG